MHPRALAICIVATCAALPACRKREPAASDSAEGSASSKAKVPSHPELLLLPWDSELFLAPDRKAPAVTLRRGAGAETSRGRAVRVVDSEGEWWRIETIDAGGLVEADVEAGAAAPIEGLEVYALQLYVPAGTGEAIPGEVPDSAKTPELAEKEPARAEPVEAPAPEELEPLPPPTGEIHAFGTLTSPYPLQAGGERPPGSEREWTLERGVAVYWPDGRRAGVVRRAHAFLDEGESKTVDGRELRCMDARVGPPPEPSTQLCFAAEEVGVRHSLAAMLGSAKGEGVEGLGLGTRGVGPANTGPNYGGGLGTLGTVGEGKHYGGPPKPSTLVLGESSATGVDDDTARRLVRRDAGKLRECYGLRLRTAPKLAGTVRLKLHVDTLGKVSRAEAEGLDDALHACLARVAKRWRLPARSPGAFEIELRLSPK